LGSLTSLYHKQKGKGGYRWAVPGARRGVEQLGGAGESRPCSRRATWVGTPCDQLTLIEVEGGSGRVTRGQAQRNRKLGEEIVARAELHIQPK
jgi:hypothetical protein